MKKIIAFILIISACALLSSCYYKPHKYGAWQMDEVNHWKECTDEGCDQRTGFAAHVFDDGSVDVDSGKKVYTCKVCEFTREEDHTARTEVSADEWAAATAPEKFKNFNYVYTVLGESMSVKTDGVMIVEYERTDEGVLIENYAPDGKGASPGSVAVSSRVAGLLKNNFEKFTYDPVRKAYTFVDGTTEILCQFGDGLLVRLEITTDGLVESYAFSRYGAVVIEEPVDDVKAEFYAAAAREKFGNVTVVGNRSGEMIHLEIENENSVGLDTLNELVDIINGVNFDGLESYTLVDGRAVYMSFSDGVSVRLGDGFVTSYSDKNIDLRFSDHGKTVDDIIDAGEGEDNETPMIPDLN